MSHLAGVAAVVGAGVRLDGALSASGSSSPVTSATRNVIGSGTLKFESLAGDDSTPQYQHNGGAWATITEGMTLAVTHGATLAVRAQMVTAPGDTTFDLRNNASNALIESVSLNRT